LFEAISPDDGLLKLFALADKIKIKEKDFKFNRDECYDRLPTRGQKPEARGQIKPAP